MTCYLSYFPFLPLLGLTGGTCGGAEFQEDGYPCTSLTSSAYGSVARQCFCLRARNVGDNCLRLRIGVH